MNEKDLELEELSLEEIMKEFGSGLDFSAEETELENTQDLMDVIAQVTEPKNMAPLVIPEPEEEPAKEEAPKPEMEEAPEEAVTESAAEETLTEETPEPEEEKAAPAEEASEQEEETPLEVDREELPEQMNDLDDTVRLDDLTGITGTPPVYASTLEDKTERIGPIEVAQTQEDEDEDAVEIPIPAPIVFRPRQRLRELKRELIAGPEKRYYELSEKGVGKLQFAMLACLIVVLACAGAGTLYAAGLVPENRIKLMVFSQVLVMLIGALAGCHQMIDGISDLFHGRFTMNTMLTVTFLASAADAALCLQEQRVPLCAAFTLEVLMAVWCTYHRRTTEMGQMDTMRKAVRLDSVIRCEDYLDGKPAFLRGEGKVADFMEHYDLLTRPERIQNIYAFIAFLVSGAIAVFSGLNHGLSMGVQIFSTSLLVAVPASFFVSVSRPMAMLERRLHSLGTVLCGWNGIKGFSGKALFPLYDRDIFPAGSCKLNGVKFYGHRTPEVIIAYAAALMAANGGGLADTFEELLTSRNGIRYEAENLQFYGNGGIGGEVCEEPVLMGSLDFLKEMGVEIPDGTLVKQAVYVAIDGELSGLFAIAYTRMKYTANGLATLCGNRRLGTVIMAEDFMMTAPFLKERFGVRTRRMIFPDREQRLALAEKKPTEDAPVLALTTQEGLAPAAYAITGSRAVRTAWKLGLAIHLLGGILGLLIMAALAVLGNTELLTPLNILAYQLVWMVPGILVTFWPRTI